MILFPLIGYLGRLGNQMFQIAASFALARRHNTQFFLPEDLDSRIHHGQLCLQHWFKNDLPRLPMSEYNEFRGARYVQQEFTNVDTGYFTLSDYTRLEGFFESELYFINCKEEVKKLFTFQDSIETFANQYIQQLRAEHDNVEVVAIHFRRGDYEEPHSRPQLFYNFAVHAINNYFSEKPYLFLVFSGGNHENTSEDIQFCKKTFNIPNVIFCEINNIIQELAIMTKCNHMILTTKSTLGWWGGYLMTGPKKVVVPKVPIGPSYNPDVLWSKEFIQL